LPSAPRFMCNSAATAGSSCGLSLTVPLPLLARPDEVIE
jgi:hypothetical protein